MIDARTPPTGVQIRATNDGVPVDRDIAQLKAALGALRALRVISEQVADDVVRIVAHADRSRELYITPQLDGSVTIESGNVHPLPWAITVHERLPNRQFCIEYICDCQSCGGDWCNEASGFVPFDGRGIR
jgi:hypothetical protein